MKIRTLVTAIVLTLVGCDEAANEAKPEEGQGHAAATGMLALNLTSSDNNGRAYRLRNATFTVSSYNYEYPSSGDGGTSTFNATLSSEHDLDTSVLTLKLVPGFYDVIFANPDWYLERRVDGAWQRVEQAVLLTSTYQSAYVYDRGVASVNFRFGVDGALIDFRSGDLEIGISIERPGEGPGDGGFGGTTGGFGGTTGGGWIDAGVSL